MNRIILLILFTCACLSLQAQVNLVKNPDLEEYASCPTNWDQTQFASHWNAIDTVYPHYKCRPDYCNTCATAISVSAPLNSYFYQYPRSGKGMMQMMMYCDETPVPPPPYYPYRDYLRGELIGTLKPGISYCITFYVNLEEASQYANNKIGAYLNNGHLDTVSECGKPITFITPQVYSTSIITDTANWTKIEGSFVATGNERYIALGNFFSKSATSTIKMPSPTLGANSWSFYLIDDVSVIETNLPADAGPDKWVPIGDSVWIGRSLDSAKGLDCKWYHHGSLIDSGAGIWAKGTSIGSKDTYTVVQTICGLVKTDTVVVLTASVGINELPSIGNQHYLVFPNPSEGEITIKQLVQGLQEVNLSIYNILGEMAYRQNDPQFFDGEFHLKLHLPNGTYVINIESNDGSKQKLKLLIRQ